MANVEIPLQKVANQTFSCLLGGQSCTILIRLLGDDLYLSLSKDNKTICQSVRLVDRAPIVQAPYTGFVGELLVVDKVGQESPDYTEWNDRWVLLYNEEGFDIYA